MSLKPEQALISVGFDKNGDAEFSVSMAVCELSYTQMKELRSIIPVAIHVAEEHWESTQFDKSSQAKCARLLPDCDKEGA